MKQNNINTVNELIEVLEELSSKYGDIPVFMDVKDEIFKIDTAAYTTDGDGDEWISLISWE